MLSHSTLHPSPAPIKVLTGIEVTTEPTKTAYTVGETFDPTGMVVTGTYSDSTIEVISDYTYSPDGALALTDTTVTITKDSFTDTVTITVSE